MSISSSLHTNAAPHHFEQIARIFQKKRNSGDSSTCDLKIQLKNGGYDMVHSMVVCAHSTVFSEALESQRAPYQPFDMTRFDANSVRRVMDWMYSGEITIPESSISDVLAVASFLRVNMFHRQIEQKIQNLSLPPIMALNIASARDVSIEDVTLDRLVVDFSEKVTGLSVGDISKLTVNSVIAVMASVLPMKKKVPLINMFILWINSKKPEKETINTIIQSLVISDISFDALYAIRFSLKQYLTNIEVASKSHLTISPSGTFEIKISTKKNEKSSIQEQPQKCIRSRSEISEIQKISDPFKSPSSFQSKPNLFHTRSEMESIRMIPDPFDKSSNPVTSPLNNTILRRETNNGFPKLFTRSEVENLQQMTDPFSKSEKEGNNPIGNGNRKYGFSSKKCTSKYPNWSNDTIRKNKECGQQKQCMAKFTPSEAQMVRQLPDPFGNSDPVIMRSDIGVFENKGNGAKQSFSGYSLNIPKKPEDRSNPLISVISSASPNCISDKSMTLNPKRIGIKNTDSEIQMINQVPSMTSYTVYHTAKTKSFSGHSAKGNDEKSQKSQKSNKSEKSQKKFPRSQYLYPN